MIDRRLRPWRLRTPAQAAASRTNGAKSSGPRTAAGKEASSQNARHHGLRSARVADDERAWLVQLWKELCSNALPTQRSPNKQMEEIAAACLRLEGALMLFGTRAAELGRLAAVFRDPHVNSEERTSVAEDQYRADAAVAAGGQTTIETLNDLRQILRYEPRFRGQRDRAIRRYLTRRGRPFDCVSQPRGRAPNHCSPTARARSGCRPETSPDRVVVHTPW
jgi:hypothetical protein